MASHETGMSSPRLLGNDAPLAYESVRRLVARWDPYAGLVEVHLLLDSRSRECLVAQEPRSHMNTIDVWTVGHSTHSADAFAALLAANDIEQVADVRTVPKSRRHPHFRANVLARDLGARGVAYAHLPQLGGWCQARPDSPNGAWRNTSFRGYADYAMSEEFATGLAQLRELAATRRTAMMCSEALWWRCHRRLIADRLVAAGDSVCHISSDARASAHQLTAFAVLGPDGQITYPRASQAADTRMGLLVEP